MNNVYLGVSHMYAFMVLTLIINMVFNNIHHHMQNSEHNDNSSSKLVNDAMLWVSELENSTVFTLGTRKCYTPEIMENENVTGFMIVPKAEKITNGEDLRAHYQLEGRRNSPNLRCKTTTVNYAWLEKPTYIAHEVKLK